MSTQETNLKAIADAIRAKEGTEAPIPAADFPARIAAIQTGTDTSDATAAAGDLLAGKTAYGASGKLTGIIPSKGESDLSVSGPTVTVPAGHYPAQASKSVAAAEQATPAISVSSGGLITATAQQAEGYVPAGSKNATQQLTVQGAQTITPGTAAKTIAAGRYLTGVQTIQGDSNLVAGNIKSGVSIFGVNGSFQGEGAKSCSVNLRFTGLLGTVDIWYTAPNLSMGGETIEIRDYDSRTILDVLVGSVIVVRGSERATEFDHSVSGGVTYLQGETTGRDSSMDVYGVSGDGTLTIDFV